MHAAVEEAGTDGEAHTGEAADAMREVDFETGVGVEADPYEAIAEVADVDICTPGTDVLVCLRSRVTIADSSKAPLNSDQDVSPTGGFFMALMFVAECACWLAKICDR